MVHRGYDGVCGTSVLSASTELWDQSRGLLLQETHVAAHGSFTSHHYGHAHLTLKGMPLAFTFPGFGSRQAEKPTGSGKPAGEMETQNVLPFLSAYVDT